MKKKIFSLMMGILLAFTGIASANELTIYPDGTAYSGVSPMYGLYGDAYTKNEYIIPASEIAPMTGGTISSMTFYLQQPASAALTGQNYIMFMKETTATTISAYTGYADATVVYQGILNPVNATMTVTFATPYTYNGGNLLVGCYNTATGNYKSAYFYGESVSGASIFGYSYSNLNSVSTSLNNFIPRTTFAYEGGAAAPELGLHVIAADGTVDELNMGPRPAGAWMQPYHFMMTYDGYDPISVSILDFTPNDGYFTMADGTELPIDFINGTEVELAIATGDSDEEFVERQFVAIYDGTRLAKIWPITAEPYSPEIPDVVELPYDLGLNLRHYYGYPTAMTQLYDNYALPHPEIEDGIDAVYKLTFNEDALLNADVPEGENGKIAIYTEDFYFDQYGIPGPDVENNYTGPQIGGGFAPYDVTLGEGTNTTGYLPCYYLYDNSLSQQLYLASELQEAGMGAGPIRTIGFYTESTFGWTMNNVKIWMANVTNSVVTSPSPLASGMTCVYEGDPVQIVGWNDFQLNGNFAWDGESNLLVLFQMNNGDWGSTIYWSYTSQSYNASAYTYRDGTGYSPETETYSMSMTNMRANTHFVGGGRAIALPGSGATYPIEDMTIIPGTYYIVASSTDDIFSVEIGTTDLPCAEQAYGPSPADDEDELDPAAVTLRWNLGRYATEYRLVFGSTYYCEDVLVDWTTDLAQSYTVTNLYNNTNYFWRVDERNGSCEKRGEVWGFTTHLNVPQNLRVEDETIFEGDDAVLSWTAIQDRTYRYYNIYQDGELIASTPANVVTTTYTVEGLEYNMNGYVFNVTAVYDEGESAFSNDVNVKVSGNGMVNGHVYEQDGVTGIAQATVTFQGTDEFGDHQTFRFTTNASGYYSGAIMAGEYDASAACEGYQPMNEPLCGNPVAIVYEETTTPVDFMLDEQFYPVAEVIAEYYPDPEDPESPYVKVYWGWNLMSAMIEDFETGDLSMFDWNTGGSYPWTVVTTHPYEGAYCLKSGGTNVASASSTAEVTVDIPRDGLFSFYSYISCESSFDMGYYYMDGAQMGTVTGLGNTWAKKEFAVTSGTHTFKWTYTKDSSVNSGEDAWFIDYIDFIHDPEPAQPGWHTYAEGEFNNALGSNISDNPRWGYMYPNGGGFGGMRLTKVALFSDTQYSAVGGNYTLNVLVGGADPDAGTVVSTMTVDVPSNQNAWVEYDLTTPVNISGNENVWVIWTANTHVSSWPAGLADGSDPNGSWWNAGDTWDQVASSYGVFTIKCYFTNREGRTVAHSFGTASENTNTPVNAPVMVSNYKPVKGEAVESTTVCNPNVRPSAAPASVNNRAFAYYRVYRTNCYNDGPYTEDNTVVLACELHDTVYIDVSWPDAAPGVYKWGVGVVYSGNRESEIIWSEPTVVPGNAEEATRANELTVYDGTTTSGYVPVYGLYCDAYLKCEYIMPAAQLAPMAGSQITDMKFYISTVSSGPWTGTNFRVFMKEVGATSISAYTGYNDATVVYQGILDGTQSTMDVHFTTPYNYGGGNLLIGFYNETIGTYHSAYYYGQTVSGASVQGYSYSSLGEVTTNQRDFLPKTTFTYSGGGGQGGQGGGIYGNDPIQEPRESPIVWSNCLDKDMYLDGVSVNVILNSADSPEGVNVNLTNLNEAEQEMYPVAPVILDETGFYAWDTFRRGDYAVSVTFDGYYPIYDTVSIWDNTELRYVMTEILNGVSGVYVSRTGWAMWEGASVGPNPGPQGGSGDEWFYDFENSSMAGWTAVDADGDGYNWMLLSQKLSGTGYGHNGSNDGVLSQSYDNSYGVLYPDNYLVSPQSAIGNGSTFSFWACGQDASYAAEHFGVAISTTGTNPSDFTTIYEHTIGSKGARYDGERGLRDQSTWMQYTVDLSAYAGQNCYIAIRHFNCYDEFYLDVDDIQLASGAKDGERHLQYYKVLCTSIDGVPIFNHNTIYPCCQLSTNEPYNAPLVEGEHYLCKVAAMYSTGLSEWSEPVEWEYEPCDHWGPVDFVEYIDDNEGNHIHWEFEHGFNPYGGGVQPGPGGSGEGEWYYYDNGVNEDAIGTGGGQFWWAVMFPAGSYQGNVLTKVQAYDYQAMTGSFSIYQGGTSAPAGSALTTDPVTFTGSSQFIEFNLANPAMLDPTQNVWVVFYNESGAAYPAACCTNTGDANGRWVSLDGAVWEDIASYGLDYTFMIRAYIQDGRGGVEAFETGMLSNGTYAFNITDVANFDERVFFLYNLMNDSRFNVINGEADGMFIISATDDNMDLEEAIHDFTYSNANQFAMMDKVQAAQVANAYKGSLPASFINSLMMDLYVASRENNLCSTADPFCTDNGMYEFPAGVNAGSGETGPDYDCLYTQPNPAWYYMRIADPGDMDIYMYSTPSVDIDFCCWGPFDDPTSPCPNGLTSDKVVSCSYSINATEDCIIPASAQTGEYYILVITNYSNQQCNINFSKISGSGTTDCGILPAVDIIGFLITRDGEYLDIVGNTVRDYTDYDEYGDHVYCVRPIYPGTAIMPDQNMYFSMGCPVCATMGCAAPMHLEGTYEWRNGQYGALISWVTDTRDIVSFNIFRSTNGVDYDKIGSIDGNHTEYFDAVEVGTYYYQVTAISDCGESMPALTANGNDFVIVTVTSVDENGGVAMYPNPTSGNVKIVANAMNHITVVNSLGQVVYDANVNCDEMTINMAQFNAGIYTVRIATESGVSVQRLTVVR